MSSHSYSTGCWKCGSEDSMMMSESNRPPSMCGECIACGYSIFTNDCQMTLAEVNELRVDTYELEPLEKLKGGK